MEGLGPRSAGWLTYMLLVIACTVGCARGSPTVSTGVEPIEIRDWKVRFGDSPRDASGAPAWLGGVARSPEWQPLTLPAFPPRDARGDHEFLWMRTTLPATTLRNPALRIDPIMTSVEFYLDGKCVRRVGDLGAERPRISGIPWHILPVPADGAPHEVALRVHSAYALIGVQGYAVLGERADHVEWALQKDVVRLLLGAVIAFMALLALVFARRRQDRPLALSFAAFGTCAGIYVVRYSHLKDLIYDAPLFWFDVMMVSFALLGWTLLGFVVALFPRAPRLCRWLWWGQGALALLFVVGGFTLGTRGLNVIPMAIQTAEVQALRVFNLAAAVVGMWVGIREWRRKNPEAPLFLVGFVAFHVALVRDILAAQGLTEFSLNTYSHYGMALTMLCLGVVVQRRYVARVREYARELGARIKERELMLADLHDGIGGITTNIRMLSEAAEQAESSGPVKETLAAINELAAEGIGELRGVMQGLDETPLGWNELAAELRGIGKRMLEPHGLDLSFEVELDDSMPPPDALTPGQACRIFREALTNVLKHSRPSRIDVRMRVRARLFTLEVENDGVLGEGVGGAGMDLGRGVMGMRTRAEHLSGSLDFEIDETARLRLELPVEGSARLDDR